MSQRKVYWKFLIIITKQLIAYIQRNQLKLQANLDTPAYNCVVALLDAALLCVDALPDNTPGS